MNVIDISNKIIAKANEIDEIRKVLIERSDARDNAEANYNKAYAIVLIKLKNKVEFEFEGQKIVNPSVTTIKEIAKGICWNEKLELDKTESMLKIAFKNLDAVSSQLTAYQSINKHLDKA